MANTFNVRTNVLSQAVEVAGSLLQSDTYALADEPNGLGRVLATGTGASQTGTTVTGLTGMDTTLHVGSFIYLETDASMIVSVTSATEVEVATSATHTSVAWTVRAPYALQDDLNYARANTREIKGTANWYSAVPTYQRPTAIGTSVVANLSNIAGKTIDARGFVTTRSFRAVAVAATDTKATLTSTGNLKHADAVDKTGVPCGDVAPYTSATPTEETLVLITDPATGNEIETADGAFRIIGQTVAGAATSPDAVEVKFFKIAYGADLSTAVAYTWEAGRPTSVDMGYGFFQRLDQLPEAAFRRVLTLGISSDADLRGDIDNLQISVYGSATPHGDELTDLSTVLTNTGNYYPFKYLPNATPSVVDAVNTLNAQVGDRNYTIGATGPVITDGQSVSGSVQALVDYVDLSGHITNHSGTGYALAGVTEDVISSFNALDSAIGDRQYTSAMLTDGQSVTASLDALASAMDITGELTNTTADFIFSDLADPANATVLEALNVINAQVGDRVFTGSVLTSGTTITSSLQTLANAIQGSSTVRVIEKISATVNIGATHTIPGGKTYIPKADYSGLWVTHKGLMLTPGTNVADGDYSEVGTVGVASGTIRTWKKLSAGDVVMYFLVGS
jgi:hypothetical protein